MPQSLAKVSLHIVFSTKDRTPFLADVALRIELYAVMATIMRNEVDTPALLINGVEDHVHLLCSLSRSYAIKTVLEVAKKETSKWVKKQSPSLSNFFWQSGYGAFSVSESNLLKVRRYIQNQEAHHRAVSFQDEFRELCCRHQVPIDERYVWS